MLPPHLKSKVFLAPMAGITDEPMRRLVHSFGGGNIVSEMVAINAIQHKNAKTYRIADVRSEPYPVTVQLVGNDAKLFAEVIPLISELGAAGIDINMGCPVKKIIGNQSGSYLMKDILRAQSIIKAARKATTLPLSVKFRKGWDNNNINAIEFAKMCEESGADYITIHGRTRSDMYSGIADWDIIAAVKSAVKIPVIGNGDVTSPHKAKEMLEYTNVDGVMIGRACLGHPWLIAQTDEFLQKGISPQEMTTNQIKETMLRHITALCEYYGQRVALGLARKYVCWYCKGLRGACRFREKFVTITDLAEALSAINEYFILCQKEDCE